MNSIELKTGVSAALSFFFYEPSLFFSSRQMHMAAIKAMSTPGATWTPYVCCPKKKSLPLSILRSMRATKTPGDCLSVSQGSNRINTEAVLTTLCLIGDVGRVVCPAALHGKGFLLPTLRRRKRGSCLASEHYRIHMLTFIPSHPFAKPGHIRLMAFLTSIIFCPFASSSAKVVCRWNSSLMMSNR
jgi:hypothetical protein